MIKNTLFRYLIVGVLNTSMGYGLTLLLQIQFGVHAVVANTMGYLIGFIVSYVLNRRFTFKSNRSHAHGIPTFAATAIFCYMVNLVVLQLSLNVMHFSAAVAQGCAMITYTVLFFIINKYIVFGQRNVEGIQ